MRVAARYWCDIPVFHINGAMCILPARAEQVILWPEAPFPLRFSLATKAYVCTRAGTTFRHSGIVSLSLCPSNLRLPFVLKTQTNDLRMAVSFSRTRSHMVHFPVFRGETLLGRDFPIWLAWGRHIGFTSHLSSHGISILVAGRRVLGKTPGLMGRTWMRRSRRRCVYLS